MDFTPEEAASTFTCVICGTGLTPMGPIPEAAIDAIRKAGLICLFCQESFNGGSFKGPYAEYLKSPAWRLLRAAAIKKAGGKCQVCNSDLLLQVHHRSYPKELGWESADDLTVLCRRCHDLFHNPGGAAR